MKTGLSDLNEHLFGQLERLTEKDMTEDEIRTESIRAKAVSAVAKNILESASLTIEAQRLFEAREIKDISYLRIGNEREPLPKPSPQLLSKKKA